VAKKTKKGEKDEAGEKEETEEDEFGTFGTVALLEVDEEEEEQEAKDNLAAATMKSELAREEYEEVYMDDEEENDEEDDNEEDDEAEVEVTPASLLQLTNPEEEMTIEQLDEFLGLSAGKADAASRALALKHMRGAAYFVSQSSRRRFASAV
jgi:hypothetical protein